MNLGRNTNTLLQSDFSELSHNRTWRSHIEKNGKKAKIWRAQALKTETPRNEEPQKMRKHIRRLPTFEKRGNQETKLWWRRFTKYIQMTQNIDLNIMTTDREILERYRAELKERIKDLFIRALGESAITDMTRTV